MLSQYMFFCWDVSSYSCSLDSSKESLWIRKGREESMGLYGGVFTPTESAVVAVFYSLLLGFVIYRSLSFKTAYEILVDASEASAIIVLPCICTKYLKGRLGKDRLRDIGVWSEGFFGKGRAGLQKEYLSPLSAV